jgi:hypothetical protein
MTIINLLPPHIIGISLMVAASYHQHVCDMTNNILLITFLLLSHIIGMLFAKTFSDLKTYGGAELLPHIISMLLYYN